MTWPTGWQPIEPGEGAGLEAELALELKPGHPLFGIPVAAIARHGGRDDVLFEIRDDRGSMAEVHLTWAGARERPPWPSTSLFKGFAEWRTSTK